MGLATITTHPLCNDSTAVIKATANYGYHFTQWNDGDTNNPRTVMLTQDTAFTAQFAKNNYTLTVLASDTTLGEVTGSTMVEYLDTVSITATVTMPHYHFVQWSDGSTETTRNVVITCDSIITAIFAIDTHTVSATVNNDNYGTVNGTGSYPYGATVSLEAVPEEGYYFVKWSNGVTDNPATFACAGDTTLSAIFSEEVTPNLCMVSVQDNHNVVMWNKENDGVIATYNIYREGNVTGEYELVWSQPFDSMPAWIDTASRPSSRSYRYRMTATDIYGYESAPSEVHKTMHLTINRGMGNQWNLMWTEYEGADFVSYMIYRGNYWNGLELIDQMPVGGNTAYTDENVPYGTVFYQVVAIKSTPCNITKSESMIRSNIATNEEVGITDVSADNVNVYVRDGRIVVEGAEGREVQIYDMLGRTVDNHALSAGIYMVRVGDLPVRKVVVLR